MPIPRTRLISLDDTPYYHCISRCVRRAFLCGQDQLTGYNFEHRRQWIVDRMKLLSKVFAVDLCAYAIMSNHYHIVIKVDSDTAIHWSDREVAERWCQLFSTPPLIYRYLGGSTLTEIEYQKVSELISTWRSRLHDLSWFMRCLNEPIARLANREDRCSGRFWEGRFRSQALLDERALLACMAYVDLNPVRAAIAQTPESSDFTSIQERIQQPESTDLTAFSGQGEKGSIPLSLKDYVEFVDWAGREIISGKKGFISSCQLPILLRLNMNSAPILDYLRGTEYDMPIALGPVSQLRRFAASVGRRFIKGMSLGRRLCPEVG